MRLTRMAGTLPLALALVGSAPVVAQQASQQSDCRVRNIPVGIFTRDGSPRPSLTSAGLSAVIGGKRVPAKSITFDSSPRRIMLLLDVSGSMTGNSGTFSKTEVSPAIPIAADLLVNVPPATQVGLAVFAERLNLIAAPTTDRAPLTEELEALASNHVDFKKELGGSTALFDAVNVGSMLGTPQLGDAIYVITDGGDNKSKTSEMQLWKSLATNGIRLFSILLFTPTGRTREETLGPTVIGELAEVTGGFAIPVERDNALQKQSSQPSPALRKSLDSIYRLMLEFYDLEFELPAPIAKPQRLGLRFSGLSPPMAKNLSVIYPDQLQPCN